MRRRDEWERTDSRAVAGELVALLAPVITAVRSPDPRGLIAWAALASARNWLRAMIARRRDGFDDLIGADLRVILETTMVGMWIRMAPVEAVESLWRDTRRARRILADRNEWDLEHVAEEVRKTDRLPPVEQLARDLTRMLTDAGFGAPDVFEVAYNLIYRGESMKGAHPGLDALIPYIAEGPQGFWVGLRQQDVAPEFTAVRIQQAVNLVRLLAVELFEAHDRPQEKLDELTAIGERLKQAAGDSFDS